MSKTVTCSTLVWLREVPHEAGTTFHIVDNPEKAKEVDPTTAAAWERNGWLAKPATKAAGEGA